MKEVYTIAINIAIVFKPKSNSENMRRDRNALAENRLFVPNGRTNLHLLCRPRAPTCGTRSFLRYHTQETKSTNGYDDPPQLFEPHHVCFGRSAIYLT